jgi:LPPG:FO 2-phospho-L-lactate transferase
MAEGGTLTAAQSQIARALGVSASVLPMAEEPVTTRVLTPGGWRGLQEFLIVDASEPEIEGVELQGIGDARPTPEVLEALEAAEVVVIGPSNPVISIGPILAVPGMRQAIVASGAPVVAVSPFVAGRAVKGPTEEFMAAARRPSTAAGVASLYEGLIQAMVLDADDPDAGPEGMKVLSCPTLMAGAEGRRKLAERVLAFARVLS